MAQAGGLSEATVKAAYESVHQNNTGQYMIGFVSIVALIVIVSKIINDYNAATKDRDGFDIKVVFDLLKTYAIYMGFIVAFPFIVSTVEYVFADIATNVSTSYNTSLEEGGTRAVTDFVKKYAQSAAERDAADKSVLEQVDEKLNPVTKLEKYIDFLIMWFTMEIYIFCLYILKYIYFFFCAGRYLWLIMLELLAPIAVILAISPKTINYFFTWCKYLFVCYLLIPFLLIADAFGEALIKVIANGFDMNEWGVLPVIGMVIIKISLFGSVNKFAFKLM